MARDISERKLVQEQLRQSQLRLAGEAEALRNSEERFRKLSETLDVEVRARTRELEERTQDVLRQSEQVRDLSWRLLRAQDDERRHIARELHDSAGQTLTALGMGLAQLVQRAGRSAPDLARMREESRRWCSNCTERFERLPIFCILLVGRDGAVLRSQMVCARACRAERSRRDVRYLGRLWQASRRHGAGYFRLVQECLTNIHRHSGSNTASIRIVREAESLRSVSRIRARGCRPRDWRRFNRRARV